MRTLGELQPTLAAGDLLLNCGHTAVYASHLYLVKDGKLTLPLDGDVYQGRILISLCKVCDGESLADAHVMMRKVRRHAFVTVDMLELEVEESS